MEEKLGVNAPENVKSAGKLFRKWIGTTLLGTKKSGLAEEKAAAELLDSIGVLFNVWPTAQTKPEGPKNIAVFNASIISITKVEKIDIENVKGKWVLISRKDI